MKQVKHRKKVTFTDLSSKDLELLKNSYSMKEDEWYCYGPSFERLFQLGLITEENRISHYGRQLVAHLAGLNQ